MKKNLITSGPDTRMFMVVYGDLRCAVYPQNTEPSVTFDTSCLLIPVSLPLLPSLPVFLFEPRHEKTNNVVSKHVQHQLVCTITEDGYKLEILDLESRGIILSMKRKQRR